MIKFIRIGNQICEGKDQFAFITSSYNFVKLEGKMVFDSIEDFSSCYLNQRGYDHKYNYLEYHEWYDRHPLSLFESLMPPDMLPKEEFKCDRCGKVITGLILYKIFNPSLRYCSLECAEGIALGINTTSTHRNIEEETNKCSVCGKEFMDNEVIVEGDTCMKCYLNDEKLYKCFKCGNEITSEKIGKFSNMCETGNVCENCVKKLKPSEEIINTFNKCSFLKPKYRPSEEILKEAEKNKITHQFTCASELEVKEILNWLDRKFGE